MKWKWIIMIIAIGYFLMQAAGLVFVGTQMTRQTDAVQKRNEQFGKMFEQQTQRVNEVRQKAEEMRARNEAEIERRRNW